MNYIRHLTGFFDRAAKDRNLNCSHMSLYMAIFQMWNCNRFKNPVSISRNDLKDLSKVSSTTTYHKCLKELHQFGYLKYEPSYHPLRGSWVYVYEFDVVKEGNHSINCSGTEVVVNNLDTSDGEPADNLSSESQAGLTLHDSLNVFKHNKLNKPFLKEKKRSECEELKIERREDSQSNSCVTHSVTDVQLADTCAGTSQSSPANGAPENIACPCDVMPQDQETVIDFFLTSNYSARQAIKFFHYFSATGWKLGGRSPIENWHAAAHSWILNGENMSSNGRSKKRTRDAGRLHSQTGKDYSEPL